MLTARSQVMNGRDPNFDEKRIWESRADMRIAKYLRDHPEVEQSPRYMDVRFWRQVSPGAPRVEVEALLEEPQEQTIDPALMAVLAERHWDDFGRRATEAWIYYGWAIFFDERQWSAWCAVSPASSPSTTRAMIRPICAVRRPRPPLNVQRVRLACGHRAPPRS